MRIALGSRTGPQGTSTRRGRGPWVVGGLVLAGLLGACAPEPDQPAPVEPEAAQQVERRVSALGTETGLTGDETTGDEFDPTVPGPIVEEEAVGAESTGTPGLAGGALRIDDSRLGFSAMAGVEQLALAPTETTFTVDPVAGGTGWYNSKFNHTIGNPNYIAGIYGNKSGGGGGNVAEYRNFFVFNLEGISGEVTQVKLQLLSPRNLGSGGATFALSRVTTSTTSLIDGTAGEPGYNDLGNDAEYGTHPVTFPVPEGSSLTYELNDAARQAVQALIDDKTPGTLKEFKLGGRLSGANPASDFYLFGSSGKGNGNNTPTDGTTKPQDVQLTIVTKPRDGTPPALSLPTDFAVEATSASGAVVTYSASASDNVDGSVTPSCTPPSGSTLELGTTTVSCTAQDQAGNAATGSFVVTVQDTTPPALSGLSGPITTEATGPAGAVVTFDAPTASDVVDGSVAVSCSHSSGAMFALGATTVTCTARDASANSSSTSFSITVQDTTAPVLSGVPAGFVKEAEGPLGAVVSWATPTAEDLVSGSVPVTCSPASGSQFALGTTQVTCSAQDTRDNTASTRFAVTVRDATPPVLSNVPTSFSVEATGPSGAPATFTSPTATDLVDGNVASSCAPASGSTFPLGATTVTCSATDAAGNTETASFNIGVVDTTPPAITVPADLTVEATGPAGATVTFSASAVDLVDGTVPVVCSPTSGGTFALGTTSVACSAQDGRGNGDGAFFTVTVVDTTPPVIGNVPADITAEATGPAGAGVNYASPTATDLVDVTVPVLCTPVSGSVFPLGTRAVSCTATDRAGNSASASFSVTVQDTTPPRVTVPADITAVATSAQGNVMTYVTSATDLVDGPLTPTCTPASGSLFAPGTTAVTCSATDNAGNTGTASFTVTVSFDWSGFLQPINTDGSSVFKLGSTVPVKFRLAGASAGISNLTARLYIAKLTDNVAGLELEVVSTSAADTGNTFRYSATDAQYIFNLNTKGLSSGTWLLRADLGDGALHTVRIALKK